MCVRGPRRGFDSRMGAWKGVWKAGMEPLQLRLESFSLIIWPALFSTCRMPGTGCCSK